MICVFSVEGKMLSSLSEKNKVSACKWRALSDNEREAFNKQANSEQAKSSPSAKKEMRKALSSLTNIVSKDLHTLVPGHHDTIIVH